MTGQPGARHAIGVANRDRAAGHIEFFRIDAEPVPAMENLRGERLIQFPQVDIIDLQTMRLEKFRHGKHRANAHFVGITPGNGDAAKHSKRLEAAALRLGAPHDDECRGAVGKLRRIAGGYEPTLGYLLPVAEDRLQGLQTFEIRLRADAFVSFQRDRSVADVTRFPVLHLHDRRHRNDFGIEASFRLRRSGAPVRFHRIFILCVPRDAVAC